MMPCCQATNNFFQILYDDDEIQCVFCISACSYFSCLLLCVIQFAHMSHVPLWVRGALVHSYLTHGNISKAASEIGVSKPTATHWISTFLETGDVEEKKSTGRKRSISDRATARARELLLTGNYSAKQVAAELHATGKLPRIVDDTTICRNVKELSKSMGAPMRAVRGMPQRELDKVTMKKRLDFCRAHLNQDWHCVMFSDRKRFLFKYVGSRLTRVTWVERGKKRRAKSVNHAQGLNIYLGLTPHGLTAVHFVTGTSKMSFGYMRGTHPAKSITTAEYKDVLTHTLLPGGEGVFEKMPAWKFQQDNDPCHKRGAQEALESWNVGHSHVPVSLLDGWPPHSGDLNPMENVWGIIECEVDAMVLFTLDDYKAAVLMAIDNFSQEKITQLYNSMSDRMADCIKLKGDKTKY